MLRGLVGALDAAGPAGTDEGAGAVQAGFAIPCADQRLHHIAEDIVALVRTVVAGLLAEAQVGADTEGAGDVGADRAGDERVEPLGELALGFRREQLPQPFGDDEAEDAVAEEFQPLVILGGLAAMGQRALVRLEVGGPAAERRGQPGGEVGAQKPSPTRLQRAAENQLTGLIHDALPSVEKKVTTALPSMRSIGM